MHDLTIINNKVSMAYAGETPWHRLGQKLEGDGLMTIEQALELANLNWNVEMEPAIILVDGVPTELTDFFRVFRSDTNATFQYATGQYHTLQNAELGELIREILNQNDDAYVSAAGSLGDKGQKIFFSIKLPDEITLSGGDKVETYLNVFSSHDGSVATTIMPSMIRVVCQNTMRAALANADASRTFKMKHTENQKDRVEEIRAKIGLAENVFEVMEGQMNDMISFEWESEADRQEYICDVMGLENLPPEYDISYNAEGKEVKKRIAGTRSTRQENLFQTINACEEYEVNNLGTPQNTLWATLNAITGFVDHVGSTVATNEGFEYKDNKLSQTMVGGSAKRKDRAFIKACQIMS
mgnify:FL=1